LYHKEFRLSRIIFVLILFWWESLTENGFVVHSSMGVAESQNSPIFSAKSTRIWKSEENCEKESGIAKKALHLGENLL
jgi:hypothetical protein